VAQPRRIDSTILHFWSYTKRNIYHSRNNVKSANNKEPIRNIIAYGIDVREAADYFGVDEDSMRAFLIKHEKEIFSAMKQAAFDTIEDLGFLESFLPMSDLEETW